MSGSRQTRRAMKSPAIDRIEPAPGQESVWDYPRPPRVEDCGKLIEFRFAGLLLAEMRRAKRALETSHPPVYSLPPADARMAHRFASPQRSWCGGQRLAFCYDVEGRRPGA